jgi:hypothetical protein
MCSLRLSNSFSFPVETASSTRAGEVVVFLAEVARKVGIVSMTAKVKEAEATKRSGREAKNEESKEGSSFLNEADLPLSNERRGRSHKLKNLVAIQRKRRREIENTD